MKLTFRLIPISMICALMFFAYWTGFYRAVDFQTLRFLHVEMIEYVNNNPSLTPLMFMGYCAGTTILSMRGGLMLNLLAGFLFPQPWCTLYFLIGTIVGASLLFLSIRIAIGERSWFNKLDAHLEKSIVSYLLFLRLCPFIPFWISNLVPAFFNVRLRTYIWTSVVGMLPKALIFSHGGKGLNTVFESAETLAIDADIQVILLCLSLFSLLPILIRKLAKE
ncbi:MAG: VTT domain-containing protein [Verrucomicrobia bacterium]|nr:VTT domain-containing protein [Verrucomicrobiota bacterium]